MQQESEMDVESERRKQGKRKAEDTEEPADTDEFFLSFFEHFTVPTQVWGCVNKVDKVGLAYLHKETNRPIIVIRLADPLTQKHIGYRIVFREEQDRASLPCMNVYTDDSTESLDDKGGQVIFYLAQLDEQYCLGGAILGSDKYWPYYQEFLTMFFNGEYVEVNEIVFKKRKTEIQ